MKMNYLSTLTLPLILLIACAGDSLSPKKYRDFDNDWQRDNLLGKVKEVTQFKANLNSKGEPSETPILTYKTTYTEFGKVSQTEYYDRNGKLQIKMNNEYNEKQQQIRSSSENYSSPNQNISLTVNEFDQNSNLVLSKMQFNDTLKINISTAYDSLNHPIRQFILQKKDTAIYSIAYKYDKASRIIRKKETIISRLKNLAQISELSYDISGNLIEVINTGGITGNSKTVHNYDSSNKLRQTSLFKDNKQEQVTEFDDHYNPISIQYFADQSPFRELKYTYQYDGSGNWNERDIQVMDRFAKDAKFKLQQRETRTILYE